MPKFMKMLNDISRSQATYRQARVEADDLSAGQYALCLAIGRAPGRSQEEIARDLCLNKSTVARQLTRLEERGYVERRPLACDRRCFSVYPTEKLLGVLPSIKKSSVEWNALLSSGIDEGEMAVFLSVLEQMHTRASQIASEGEVGE